MINITKRASPEWRKSKSQNRSKITLFRRGNYSFFQAKDCFLGAQMLFVAFGALVLVPLLTGLNPNVALFTAGLGTIVFQVITRGKVPVFLASSFAFIAPIIYGVKTWGVPAPCAAWLPPALSISS